MNYISNTERKEREIVPLDCRRDPQDTELNYNILIWMNPFLISK